MTHDFIIAGGGIGGTVLAHLLTRGGKKVLVLEKSTAPPALVRPEGLWPATVALLSTLLSRNDAAPLWIPLNGVEVAQRQRRLLSIDTQVFERAGARLMMTDPNNTREQLMRPGAFELRRGMEVIDILQDGGKVRGVRARKLATGTLHEFNAEWTIGDDGVNSKVRQACGIPLSTSIFPLEILTFGFTWPENLPAAVAHIWMNPHRAKSGIVAVGAAPMPGGKGAALVPVRAAIFDHADAKAGWQELCDSDPCIAAVVKGVEFPEKLARIRRPWGHAEHYGAPGAILMGDAAHPVSPVGGQGANMSVADAVALAAVILGGSADIIGDYERRRRPANERSIDFTRRAARALSWPPYLTDPLFPWFLRYVNLRPRVFERLIRAASSAFRD